MEFKKLNTTKKCCVFSIFILLYSTFLGCAPTISQFSETAYQQAVQLKVKSLSIIGKSVEPFIQNESEANELKQELLTAYEYAKGRPKNAISARQWEIMIDPERNLMGGFFVRWQEQGTLSSIFTEEYSSVISDAFDTIIGLESGKIKPAEVK